MHASSVPFSAAAFDTVSSGGSYPAHGFELDAAGFWQTPSSGYMLQLQLSPTAFDVQTGAIERDQSGVSAQSDGCVGSTLEPSREPCAGEIPWADLVFWLGDDATGSVEACACPACWREWQCARVRGRRLRPWRYAPYGALSAKIPRISLPRIEGVN